MTNPILDTISYLDTGGSQTSTPRQVVERWHDDNHPGRFDHCDQQPCHAVVRAAVANASDYMDD